MTVTATRIEEGSGALSNLSIAMVGLYKKHIGRGPTRVRSSYAGSDCVVCVLEDTMTAAERTLAEIGEHERLRAIRSAIQHSFEEDFKRAAEKATGRPVRSFLSSFDPTTGAAAEVFLLGPS